MNTKYYFTDYDGKIHNMVINIMELENVEIHYKLPYGSKIIDRKKTTYLVDKYKGEIFEGDVIEKIHNNRLFVDDNNVPIDYKCTYWVKWNVLYNKFELVSLGKFPSVELTNNTIGNARIIGNVIQNPEICQQ